MMIVGICGTVSSYCNPLDVECGKGFLPFPINGKTDVPGWGFKGSEEPKEEFRQVLGKVLGSEAIHQNMQ
jgi:hypothetical protein